MLEFLLFQPFLPLQLTAESTFLFALCFLVTLRKSLYAAEGGAMRLPGMATAVL